MLFGEYPLKTDWKENKDRLIRSVWGSVRFSIWDSVGYSVRYSVETSIWYSVGYSVGYSASDSVWKAINEY